jgi:hypothetical protein
MEPLRIVVVRAYDDRTMVPPRQTSMPVLKVTYADALPNLVRQGETARALSFLGTRFWGQVRGGSGELKGLRGRGVSGRPNGVIAGKTRREARLLRLAAVARNLHGKEGVDGSSPSEGSAKAPQIGAFWFAENLHDLQRAVGMEPFMEPSGSERTLQSVGKGRIRPEDCLMARRAREHDGLRSAVLAGDRRRPFARP